MRKEALAHGYFFSNFLYFTSMYKEKFRDSRTSVEHEFHSNPDYENKWGAMKDSAQSEGVKSRFINNKPKENW